MIKPEFFSDEKIANLPLGARLLFIGMWNFADDCGVLHNNCRKLLGEIFPNDKNIFEGQVKKWVGSLQEQGFIFEIAYNGGSFLKIKNWDKHQKVPNPSEKQWIPDEILKEKLESNETVITENSIKDKDKDKDKDTVCPTSPQDIVNEWNRFAEEESLAKVIKLTDKRKSQIKKRLEDKDFNIYHLFQRIEQSDFLLGKKTDWKVDLDFIIKNETNFVKIMEGKYATNKTSGGATPDELRAIVQRRADREQAGS